MKRMALIAMIATIQMEMKTLLNLYVNPWPPLNQSLQYVRFTDYTHFSWIHTI